MATPPDTSQRADIAAPAPAEPASTESDVAREPSRPDWDDSDHAVFHSRQRGARVRVGSDLVVNEGERAGDVVVVGGSLVVRGEVDGNAVAVLGSVRLEPGARVSGDAVAVGGTLDVADSARINGEATQVSVSWPHGPWSHGGGVRLPAAPEVHGRWLAMVWGALTSLRIGVLVVVALLIALLGGRWFERHVETIRTTPGATLVTGVVGGVLLPVAFIGLAVTLVLSILGVALLPLLPLLALVVALLTLVGFAAALAAVGRGWLRLFGARSVAAPLAVIAGSLPVFGLTLASRVVLTTSGEFSGWPVTVAIAGAAIELLVWVLGLGPSR